MSMDNLTIENTEIEDQAHKMWAEGTADNEPTIYAVQVWMEYLGWNVKGIDIWFDKMQGFWRWSCDLVSKL